MKEFYEFATNSPILTFFTILIIMQGLVYIVHAVFK